MQKSLICSHHTLKSLGRFFFIIERKAKATFDPMAILLKLRLKVFNEWHATDSQLLGKLKFRIRGLDYSILMILTSRPLCQVLCSLLLHQAAQGLMHKQHRK